MKYFKYWRVLFFLILGVKLVLAALFSSDYSDQLFIPFVQHFLGFQGNPWNYFFAHPELKVEFPYHSGMLYGLALFQWPLLFVSSVPLGLKNLVFKLPTLVADLALFWGLLKVFPKEKFRITLLYFSSPIILYAAYMHSQLDLLPTAFLVGSFLLLSKDKFKLSAVLLGLAISLKFHTVAALPLFVLFVLKKKNLSSALTYCLTSIFIFFLLIFPYGLSEGYLQMVWLNAKQHMVFDAVYSMGSLNIYLSVFVISLLYLRFSAYRNSNADLMVSFLAIVFSVFLMLVVPSPGWYVWVIPFWVLFLLRIQEKKQYSSVLGLFFVIQAVYWVYFLFFYKSEFISLKFLGYPINLLINVPHFSNLAFTALEIVMAAMCYALYRFGVQSISVYHTDHTLIIGISGDSASGKTNLLNNLDSLFKSKVVHLEGDGDHKWERGDENWDSFTHLDPKANHLHRQAESLRRLKLGQSIQRRDYDHHTGKFTELRTVKTGDLVILSGLHTFYLPLSRQLIDIKIYLDTQEDLRRFWKIKRDTQERGYSQEKVIEQMNKRQVDAQKYIHPQQQFADLTIGFFALTPIEMTETNHSPQLGLKVSFDANIMIDNALDVLRTKNIAFEWDYEPNLKNQYLILKEPLNNEVLEELTDVTVANSRDILPEKAQWNTDYSGFIQWMVFVLVAEKLKDK